MESSKGSVSQERRIEKFLDKTTSTTRRNKPNIQQPQKKTISACSLKPALKHRPTTSGKNAAAQNQRQAQNGTVGRMNLGHGLQSLEQRAQRQNHPQPPQPVHHRHPALRQLVGIVQDNVFRAQCNEFGQTAGRGDGQHCNQHHKPEQPTQLKAFQSAPVNTANRRLHSRRTRGAF